MTIHLSNLVGFLVWLMQVHCQQSCHLIFGRVYYWSSWPSGHWLATRQYWICHPNTWFPTRTKFDHDGRSEFHYAAKMLFELRLVLFARFTKRLKLAVFIVPGFWVSTLNAKDIREASYVQIGHSSHKLVYLPLQIRNRIPWQCARISPSKVRQECRLAKHPGAGNNHWLH